MGNKCLKKAYLVRCEEAQEMFLAHGQVAGRDCSAQQLDTGANQTVRPDLLPKASYAGERVRLKTANGQTQEYPVAVVDIEVGGMKVEQRVAAMLGLSQDALLGSDCRLIYRPVLEVLLGKTREVNAVSTRSQVKGQEQREREEEKAIRQSTVTPLDLSEIFDFEDDMFKSGRVCRNLTRREKRQQAIDRWTSEHEPEATLAEADNFQQEQREDDTLMQAWKETDQAGSRYELKEGRLFHKVGEGLESEL